MPNMLTTKQATELTGYNDTTINNWAADGKIKAVNYYGKNLISKESLAEYLASYEDQRIARPSLKHRAVIEAFIDRGQESVLSKTLTLLRLPITPTTHSIKSSFSLQSGRLESTSSG